LLVPGRFIGRIHDPVNRVSGMYHFMLPGHISESDMANDRTARYCITAMKIIIRNLTGMGVKKTAMRASIFGSGTVTGSATKSAFGGAPLAGQNVRFAKLFLEMEDIPLCQDDTGGPYSRKIIMDVRSGRVYMKRKTGMEDMKSPLFTAAFSAPATRTPR